MKAITYLLIPALAFAMTSCLQDEDIMPGTDRDAISNDITEQSGTMETPGFEPNPSPDVVITILEASATFGPGQEFQIPIDVDQDGNLDFVFSGTDMNSGPYYQQSVYLMAAGNNKVNTRPGYESLCGNTIHTVPIEETPGGQTINGEMPWYNVGVFYLRTNYNGCEIAENYYEMENIAYFGIRMHLEGQDHYGWIQIKSSGPGRNGYPNCSSYFTVKKVAYNTVPGEGLRAR